MEKLLKKILVFTEEDADAAFEPHLSSDIPEYTRLTLDDLGTNPKGIRFDQIIIVIKEDAPTIRADELLTKIHNNIKPGGRIAIRGLSKDNVSKGEYLLKTNGFVKVKAQVLGTGGKKFNEIEGFKPAYAVGSSQKLNLAKAAVWKLDDDLDDDVETIDPDALLDEDDFKKPDKTSLQVCATTGKRKACKGCSCGLADELDAERAAANPTEAKASSADAKSSCGSCYLGDAFRCASCPYLGMPAFKPGEKVALTDGLLQADA